MNIRDLDEKVEHDFPFLVRDTLTNLPERRAVLSNGVLGQQVDSPPEKCERIIHALDSRSSGPSPVVAGGRSGYVGAQERDVPGHSGA
ncbi:hypothetical protein [Streptomyces sp. SYP-A7185]|uniref:hypothetical protein n=1 Tax=Streptomyces sp. SYP-A7185 TaxID=3040076 RepID=UPI0038F63A58